MFATTCIPAKHQTSAVDAAADLHIHSVTKHSSIGSALGLALTITLAWLAQACMQAG